MTCQEIHFAFFFALTYRFLFFRDFDALLYLCEGGFQYLPLDTFTRLIDGVVFPVYAVAGTALFLVLLFSYFQKLRYIAYIELYLMITYLCEWKSYYRRKRFHRLCVLIFRGSSSILDEYPELVFNLILDVFFGVMAMTTLRMKFLWMPHMCILAAGVISHQDTWRSCLSSINFKGFLVNNSSS